MGVPEEHQMKIARSTLRMNDVMANVMGGMTKVEALRLVLVHAVTEYDIKQSSKASYNRYALPQMIGAIADLCTDVENGLPIRQAILKHFTGGRLLDRLLKVANESPATNSEHKYGY